MRRSHLPEIVLFDLDGVLVDSRPAMISSIRAAVDSLGLDGGRLGWDDVRPLIGPPLLDGFTALLPRLGGDAALAERCVRAYRSHYAERMLGGSALYPGVATLIDGLVGQAELLVATSKPERFAVPLLAELGLLDRFVAVFAPELDLRRESKAQTIARALSHRPTTGRAAMIGDTLHDVVGARSNGIPCVGVLWGFGTRDELEAAGVDRLVTSPAELPAVLAAM